MTSKAFEKIQIQAYEKLQISYKLVIQIYTLY